MSLQSAKIETLPWVAAELNYLAPPREKPRTYTYDPPSGQPRTTAVNEPHRVQISNARPILREVSLDEEGFGLLQHKSRVRDFHDDDEVRWVYYKEAEQLLKEVTGADRVHIFDHTVRRRIPGAEDRQVAGTRQPVPRVHVDHTETSGPQRVRDLLPEEGGAPAARTCADHQSVAADPRSPARLTARRLRRLDRGGEPACSVRPRLSEPGRRDLLGHF